MKYERNFYKCNVCGNIVGLINNGGGTLSCCGQTMEKLVPNTSDGAGEKHVPAIERAGNTVKVQIGEVEHPMVDEHFIQWILLAQEDKTQRVALKPGIKPVAEFIVNDGPVTVYEYCNLHGLWAAEG